MNLNTNFKVLKKCRGKLECLIFEMLIIRNKRPTLNTQADSIRQKPPREDAKLPTIHAYPAVTWGFYSTVLLIGALTGIHKRKY